MISIHYIKEKRNKVDYCNICGKEASLTWDHVPPKGITHGEAIIANTAFADLPDPNQYMKRFQSGIKYRSICQECNNVLLGENDKVFQQFIDDVQKQIQSGILLKEILVTVKINRLCRAMIGHLLAAKNSYEPDVIPDEKMRAYMLNSDAKLTDIELYTWIYPYNSIVIARDFVTKGFYEETHPAGMVSGVVTSFPIAYMVTDQETDCGVDDLGAYTTNNIDDMVEVKLHFETMYVKGTQNYKPFNWPINISNDKDNGAMFALGGSVLQEDSRLGLKG